ncbi:DNA alkylation repair protein [Streptomyces endophyticus]|uniref:DNA alkylation repair protein n=1 Tax=Streptomyces endophyticus TaxID=714166 RepID=A0ABU6FDA1_9ACTN|nr:DNA alkylation repair protein [Streptomyces endophyticus]MEB8342007.1 DNA alkylation repair protein [Streptomyces endophyticus]
MTVAAPPPSALADTLLARLPEVYGAAADPGRAAQMRAYMKDVAPFLGLTSPVRRELTKAVLDGTPRPDEGDLTAVALRCWALPEREYAYFAIDYLRRHVRHLTSGFLPVARELITTVPWWDTVDHLAAHIVGGLVAADPKLRADMDAWIGDEDLWIARTALLHQLRHKDATDQYRLFAYCLRQSGHPDFFIRKAIGWALREYAKTDPDAVRSFVAAHRDTLAPLSAREALKKVGG